MREKKKEHEQTLADLSLLVQTSNITNKIRITLINRLIGLYGRILTSAVFVAAFGPYSQP